MVEQTSPCNAHLSSHALPNPPPPSAPVTSVRNHMIYHTNIPLSTILIALISLLTFPTIPPACIFHGWPRMASVYLQMMAMKNTQKKRRCYISHSVPRALCTTIMFTLCSLSSTQLYLPLHVFLSTWRYCLQKETDERHPATSSRSETRRALMCWRFIRQMKGSRGASKSFKAWPSPPLVTKVAQHVLRGLWRNLARPALSYAHLSTFPASAGPAPVFMTVYVCVEWMCVFVGNHTCWQLARCNVRFCLG